MQIKFCCTFFIASQSTTTLTLQQQQQQNKKQHYYMRNKTFSDISTLCIYLLYIKVYMNVCKYPDTLTSTQFIFTYQFSTAKMFSTIIHYSTDTYGKSIQFIFTCQSSAAQMHYTIIHYSADTDGKSVDLIFIVESQFTVYRLCHASSLIAHA